MTRYLSPEWLDAADEAASADDGLRAATQGTHLVVQQVVTDAPGGEVAFHVALDDGEVRMVAGQATDPTVTFTQDYATAAAVTRGELSAQAAFMTGRIRVRGDLPKLVECQPAFTAVDDVFRSLRQQTEY